MLESLIILVAGILVLGLAASVLEWTLRPLLLAARTSQAQRTFILTDLIWLVLQLQLAMAFVTRLFPANASTTSRVWGLVVLAAAAFAFWLASLQAVSQAGVRQPLRRAAVFMIALPGAIAAFVGLPLLFVAFLTALGSTAFGSLAYQTTGYHDLRLATVQLAVGICGAALIRRVCAWSIAEPSAASRQ